jgi:hypothetical protein
MRGAPLADTLQAQPKRLTEVAQRREQRLACAPPGQRRVGKVPDGSH